MKRSAIRTAAILAFCLPVVLTACGSRSDWLNYRGKQGKGYTSTSIQPPIAVKWKLRLQYQDDPNLSFNPPAVLDDTIYFGSSDGNFYALDIESGYMRWVFPTSGPINSVPAVDDDNVYFGSNDGWFYAVSRENGELLWSFNTGSTVASSTVRYEDNVIFTSDVGATYVFSPEGEEKFNIPNLNWLRHTFQMYEDVMYFAPGPPQEGTSLGAYDFNTRSYLWILRSYLDNAVWYSFPALKGKYLFYGTAGYPGMGFDLTYYALDRNTGDIIWENRATTEVGPRVQVSPGLYFRNNLEVLDYMAPSIWKNTVIFTSGDTTVRAFAQNTGATVWEHTFQYPTSSPPAVGKNRVYLGVHGDNLSDLRVPGMPGYVPPRIVCLSARNGKTLWELEIEGSILSGPVIAGKWIIFGTDRNVFYVLEEVL